MAAAVPCPLLLLVLLPVGTFAAAAGDEARGDVEHDVRRVGRRVRWRLRIGEWGILAGAVLTTPPPTPERGGVQPPGAKECWLGKGCWLAPAPIPSSNLSWRRRKS